MKGREGREIMIKRVKVKLVKKRGREREKKGDKKEGKEK